MALQALAVGTQDELCRPCVDCGLYTGCYCDGNDWGECFAADRLPLCTTCDRLFNMCHFCRGQLWAVPPAHRDPARYAPAAGADPPRGYDDPVFYVASEGARPFQGRTAADRAAQRPRTMPKAKPPPTPAMIAGTRTILSLAGAGYQAGPRRPKAKAAPDAAFRAAERELIALLGAAPLDDDPIEEPSPSVPDPIEDF